MAYGSRSVGDSRRRRRRLRRTLSFSNDHFLLLFFVTGPLQNALCCTRFSSYQSSISEEAVHEMPLWERSNSADEFREGGGNDECQTGEVGRGFLSDLVYF